MVRFDRKEPYRPAARKGRARNAAPGRGRWARRLLLVALTALSARTAVAQDCGGDCDGSGTVEVNELILGVNIALGLQPISACRAFANSDNAVTVAQLIVGVNNALAGCAVQTTPTGTATQAPASTPTASAQPIETATPSPTATPLSAAAACSALNGMTIGGAHIALAALIPGNAAFPEHCKVLGTIPTHLNFEVRLPTDWNRRSLSLGGAALDGFIPDPEELMFAPAGAAAGYVTIGSDSGHQASLLDGSWALDDPEAVENFGYLATHKVLEAARAIIVARYGRGPDHTYYFGSSSGGREGLIAAQRWPNDFDGIVALEPAYDLTALELASNRVAQVVFGSPGARLSAGKLATLAQAELAACDALDGVADGIISNVAACHFDPTSLRCSSADSEHCLTDAQIETVRTVHGELMLDVELANGVRSYPGWPIGHELAPPGPPGGWPFWITGTSAAPASAQGFVLADQVLRYLVTHDPELDTLHFSPAAHQDDLLAFSTLFDATDPDLSAFTAHGGKLILWHGLADYAISPKSTIHYYEQIVDTAGGQPAADGFVRFYTSPGIGHLNDGPGAGTSEFLAALTAWVEDGTAPGDLMATSAAPGSAQPRLTRPLCRHPNYPRYVSGDVDDAASFVCDAPS